MTNQSEYITSFFENTEDLWTNLHHEYKEQIKYKNTLNSHLLNFPYLFDSYYITYNEFLHNKFINRFNEIIFKCIELNQELLGISIHIITPTDSRCEQFDNKIRILAQLTYQLDVAVQNINHEVCIHISEPIVIIIPIVKIKPQKFEFHNKKLLYLIQIKTSYDNAIHLKLAKDTFLKLQQKLHANIYYTTDNIKALISKFILKYWSVTIQMYDNITRIKDAEHSFMFLVEINEGQNRNFIEEMSKSNLTYVPFGEATASTTSNSSIIELKSENKALFIDLNKLTEIKEESTGTRIRKNNLKIEKKSDFLPARELKISRNKITQFLKRIKGKCPDQFKFYFPKLYTTSKGQTLFDIEFIPLVNGQYLVHKSEIILLNDMTDKWEEINKGILNTISSFIASGYSLKNLQISYSSSANYRIEEKEEEIIQSITKYFSETKIILVNQNNNQEEVTAEYVQIVASNITDDSLIISNTFKSKGDLIILIGATHPSISPFYSYPTYFDTDYHIDFSMEMANIQLFEKLLKQKLVRSATSVGKHGLYYTLLTCAARSGLGFDITTHSEIRNDVFLFGDLPARFLITVAPDKEEKLFEFLHNQPITFTVLGHVTKEELRVDDISFGFISDYVSMLK